MDLNRYNYIVEHLDFCHISAAECKLNARFGYLVTVLPALFVNEEVFEFNDMSYSLSVPSGSIPAVSKIQLGF